MPASARAISKLGVTSTIVVIGMLILASVVIFSPGLLSPSRSTQSARSTSTSGQNALSTISSRTAPTSSCPSLWPYPSTFNETLVLDNSTLLYPASQTHTIGLPARQSLYIGFSLVNQAEIVGSVASSSPIDLSVIANTRGGSVFPIGPNDTTVFSKTGASEVAFYLPSPISGSVGPGNYAILLRNSGASQANVTVNQGIQVSYYPC